jgi:ubiquitin-activating enzyme E1
VLLSEDCRHALEDGDEVEFVGVDGMEELRAGGARAVTVTGAHTFLIPDDARGYGAFGGGYCRELPRKRSASFRSLREELQEPTLAHACSGGGWADEPLAPEHMHAAFRALDAFEVSAAWRCQTATVCATNAHAASLAQATQGAAASASGAAVDLASSMNLPAAAAKLFQRLTQAPAADVCPVAAVLGALASAEALKAASGVFMPLQQWLFVDLSDAAPHGAQQAAEDAAAGAGASHTTPHVAAFGAAALDTLASLRLLLVGAGGIGGEALKNFALLGVGRAASGGSITVADDDVVAPANLSRGVLLRATDVGRAKAEAIAERAAALALQPSVQHVLARITSEGTSGLLSDDALSQFGVVAAAVNSFASRLALDERCVRARLAWVDAGVEGPLAHVHPVVPFASVPWSAGARDPPGREAPSCVLRNFPYLPWHTVDWARAQFDALYQAMPAEVNAYLSKRDYLEALAKKPATARLHALRALGESLVHHRPVSLQACVAWARAQFDELFRAAPQALLAAFPPGATAPDGAPFWCARAAGCRCLAGCVAACTLTQRVRVAGTAPSARRRHCSFRSTTSCTSASWRPLPTCMHRCTASKAARTRRSSAPAWRRCRRKTPHPPSRRRPPQMRTPLQRRPTQWPHASRRSPHCRRPPAWRASGLPRCSTTPTTHCTAILRPPPPRCAPSATASPRPMRW